MVTKNIPPSSSIYGGFSVDELTADSAINEQSGLYVDVKNLQNDAKDLIGSLIDNWPSSVPSPIQICLYVKADMVELWRTWALSRFESQSISVKDIQHFTVQRSKNSADIAIAVDVIVHLLKSWLGSQIRKAKSCLTLCASGHLSNSRANVCAAPR